MAQRKLAMYARRWEEEGDRIFVGVYPSPERVGLRVVAAKPTYILAMKLSAMQRATADDRDFQDAAQLAAVCGVNTVGGLRDHFRKFFPDQTLPAAVELRLRELVDQIRAKPASWNG